MQNANSKLYIYIVLHCTNPCNIILFVSSQNWFKIGHIGNKLLHNESDARFKQHNMQVMIAT
jgi:hypothetical protein